MRRGFIRASFERVNSSGPARWRRELWFVVRVALTVGAGIGLMVLAVVALLYFQQHSMIYHPRRYTGAYAHALPPGGMEIDYTMPFGGQAAYYLPGADEVPQRLWIAFCGNGSLALDWTTILRGYPQTRDAFLLIDYPGYGKNSGYATIASTRATALAALRALFARLHMQENQCAICTIGHSLGAAAALDFATQCDVQRIVAIAPFTTLRDEAATIIGRPLASLMADNYDNCENLQRVFARNPAVQVAIFHGTGDEVIPFRLGQKLAQQFPSVNFYPVPGAGHVTVLEKARPEIISWMNR